MKKNIILCVLTCIAYMTSCSKIDPKLTSEEIEQKYGSAIVLIQNKYYFTASFGDLTIYFTGINEDGDLENSTTDESEIKYTSAYGTGFFVSENGKIATNHHVVVPTIDEETIKEKFSLFKNVFRTLIETEITNYTDTINQLNNIWIQTEDDSYEEAQVELLIGQYKNEREELQETLYKINSLNESRINLTLHSRELVSL